MEVAVPDNTSHCLDSSCGSLIADPHNLIQISAQDLSMSDLKTCLTEILNIDEIRLSTSDTHSSLDKNCIENVVRDSDCNDIGKNVSGACGWTTGKCLSKCATFPSIQGPKSSGDMILGDKENNVEDTIIRVSEGNSSAKPANLCYARSTSLPDPLNLISAIKGSREKNRGALPKKLSVTWGPDVYDPIPTSVSHVPSDRSHRYRSGGKRSGKYKQNSGKSSRGGKSKQHKNNARRSSGSSSNINCKFNQPFLMGGGGGGGAALGEDRAGSLGYSVGSSDPFCGSSFLKESVTKLHFSVAEAT